MCAGAAALFGPPSVVAAGCATWWAGHAAAVARIEPRGRPPPFSGLAFAGGVGSGCAIYSLQRRTWVSLFDEGGALSLAKVSSTMGEPLKITSWREFYRSAGPPAAARLGAAVLAFFVGGAVSAVGAHRIHRG